MNCNNKSENDIVLQRLLEYIEEYKNEDNEEEAE